MKKLVALLLVSLAIRLSASDTYVYPPGLNSAIQHWQYPNTTAMNTDFGFYAQDVGKIAFNIGDGIYYRLADTAPTWIAMATGGGGGSTTFLGLIDTPSSYTGAGGKLVAVNSGASALEFVAAAGGGNVSNVGTPAADEMAVWTDPTHIKGVRTLSGGAVTGHVLTKLGTTDYDYGWVAPTGGGGVGTVTSLTATTPILVTPSPITSTGVISLDPATDLAALEALTGSNTIYYRSGTNAWSPVVIGSNLTFSGGTLAASTGGTGTNAFGTITVSGQTDVVADTAPDTLTLVAGTNVTITTNATTDTVTIASSGGAGGVTSLSATSPIQVTPNPIIGTGTISIESGSDLAALEALTGTNTIYYRSGISAWSPATMGSNMTFSAGALAAGNANWDTGYNERRQWDGGSTNLNATLGRSNLGATTVGANVFTLTTPGSTSWLKVSTLGGVVAEDAATTKTSLGLNITNWDTAFTDRMKWDTSLGISGGTTGQGRTALGATTAGSNLFTLANPTSTSWIKVGTAGGITLEDAATTKSSLSLTKADVGLGSVTNDVQTQAVIVPNTIPTDGQLLIGNTASNKYFARTITGSGATITIGAVGGMTISNIANASLINDTITIAGTGVALGGTITRDTILGTSTAGYMKHGIANTVSSVATIPNADLANNDIQIGNAGVRTALGGAVTADGITGATGFGYMKRTLANTYTATTTSIPNADLANSSITIGGTSTALGGAVLGSVTNDAQTKAAVMPNTVPTSGQIAIGNGTGTQYVPRTITGDVSVSATGVTALTVLGSVTNDVQTKASIVPNIVPTPGQILVGNVAGTAYAPRVVTGDVTVSATGVTAVSNVANSALVGNGTMTFANAAVALGGTVNPDNAIGLAAGTGLVKRSALNSYTIAAAGTDYAAPTSGTAILKGNGAGGFSAAVAGTDYKTGTSDTVKVVMLVSTAGGTYTVPAGCHALYVEGVGGGGGGGSYKITAGSTGGAAGGGGGGGGYAAVYIATPAATYAWDTGTGGTGGPATGGIGTAGGTTTFGTVLTATGGGIGIGNTGAGFQGSAITAVGGAGGVGTVGMAGSLVSGSDGTSGMMLDGGPGVGKSAMGGVGGSSHFGGFSQGGVASGVTQQAGNAGCNYGGGGSGNAQTVDTVSTAGGAGAQGVIRVWEIY